MEKVSSKAVRRREAMYFKAMDNEYDHAKSLIMAGHDEKDADCVFYGGDAAMIREGKDLRDEYGYVGCIFQV